MNQPGMSEQARRTRLRDQRLQQSKLIAVLLALACVVIAAVGVRVSEPPEDNFQVLKGELDTMIMIDGAELTVSDVRVGQRIGDGEKIENRTSGMFVLIRVQLANRTELRNVSLNKSRLLSGDRIYETYASATNISASPGYVSMADFLYEVDPEEIDGLTLEIWSQGILSGYHARARIHLGITTENVDKWRAAGRDNLIIKEDFQQTKVLS